MVSEQHSRLEEQETNAQMLKELQTLIATERDHKEALNIEVNPPPTSFTHALTLDINLFPQMEELNRELYSVREQVSREK